MRDFLHRVFRRSRPDREEDVPVDPALANSRDAGGDPARQDADAASTTGTGPNETFVGRVSGQDLGYAEETGAERRAEAARHEPTDGSRD
jgi:hypothetical protein